MISQVLSQSRTPSILELGTAVPEESGRQGIARAKGCFSTLLAGLGAEKGSAEGSEDEPKGESDAALAIAETGIALAASGKILPPVLPSVAAPAETGGEDERIAVDPNLAPIDIALPVLPATANGLPLAADREAPVVTNGSGAPTPGHAQMAQPLVMQQPGFPDLSEGEPADLAPQARRGDAAPANAVKIEMAAPPSAKGEAAGDRETAPGRQGHTEFAARAPAKAGQDTAGVQFAPTPTAPAQTPATGSTGPDPVQSTAAARPPLEMQITRELGRIADSLATARESMAAKTATLDLSHDDFGQLSLRIDQSREGRLAVQISAADPDAHRAVAAAVAERPAFGQSDTGGQGQQHSQTQGNGAARGNGHDREGTRAGHDGARHERHQERRDQPRAETTRSAGTGRSGVFA